MTGVSGILLVDKPEGPTSRRVGESLGRCFARPRKRRGDGSRFRIGHAGTLDPLATGLLLVLVGRGTRLQPFLQGMDKRYTATVRLGVATHSLDRDGEITGQAPVPSALPDLDQLAAAFTGEIMQTPPVVSALKRDGRSLHELARRDADTPPPPPRPVTIHALSLTAGRWAQAPEPDEPGHLAPDGLVHELHLDVSCGSGTYVRSLARDLAEALGTVGHIHALRRLEVGPFQVDQAIAADAGADAVRAALQPLSSGLPHLPAITLTDEQCARLRNGTQPDASWVAPPVPPLYRLQDPAGELVAVGRRDPETGLPALAAVFPED